MENLNYIMKGVILPPIFALMKNYNPIPGFDCTEYYKINNIKASDDGKISYFVDMYGWYPAEHFTITNLCFN